MKAISKTLYLLFGGALMLSACSQADAPDITDDSDRRIVFHLSLPDLSSRAAEITTGLSYLRLTAFDVDDERYQEKEYFSNQNVEKDANSAKFISENCVWPDPGLEDHRLHFFAYYPELPEAAKLVNGSTKAGSTVSLAYKVDGYKVAEDIADQVDFVTAYTTGTMETHQYSGISLGFRHQLSRIEVMAKGAHKSSTIEVAGVSFGSAVMSGSFTFQTAAETDGAWTAGDKGNTTYIFRNGDKIVTVGADPVSIMGAKIDDTNENCAMLIPCAQTAWAFATDVKNTAKGLYLNVLLRVIDATPTTGKGEQRYPYTDCTQGLNALNIPIVLLGVDSDGKVTDNYGTLYKKDGKYFSDSEKKNEFTVPAGKTVREFGWAAVPVSADWQPGKIYTYTLDYTSGVGVHGPETPGTVTPMAGDPIISDRVGVSLGFQDWLPGANGGVTVPGN